LAHRPLIDTGRREILDYLEKRRIPFRQDRTNRDRRFLRNRIRHDLVPILESFNPNIVSVLAGTADRLRDEDLILEGLVAPGREAGADSDRADSLLLTDLHRRPEAIRRRQVLAAMRRFLGSRRRIGSRHVDAVLDLADRNSSGRSVALPGSSRAVRRPDRIDFLPSGETTASPPYRKPLTVPGRCRLPQAEVTLTCRIVPRSRVGADLRDGGEERAYLDADRVGTPLAVRNRGPGDRFRPFGAPGMKKLQDFFVDRKIPAELRSAWPLVTSGDDIVWVVGCQIDDRFRVQGSTRKVLVLEQQRAPGRLAGPKPRTERIGRGGAK